MKEAKRGDRVSLNKDKRLFFFQEEEGGINLTADATEVAIIPENATDHQIAQINHALKAEHLVLGWPEKTIDVPDRDSEIVELLANGRNKINEWIHNLKDDKKIRNETKILSLERIIALEKSGKNRSSVISVAEDSLGYIGGVSSVEESEQEKLEIKLTIGDGEESAVK